ncbi:MAG: YceI family protein [Deltaproteobacteria bacterium]|nr:YceI family protein [Deltaproteobacteria bacterium]
MKRLFALIISLALLAPLSALAATYNLDPLHSAIQFKVKHLMITNVTGVFEKFKGTVVIDDQDITRSKVNVSVETASLNTNIAKRDEHLRSPDFFDVAKFPAMTFVSTRVEKEGPGRLKVTGNLTIKGVSKPVVLTVDGPTAEIKGTQGESRRGASATTTVNRHDFGVNWSKKLDGGGLVVADDVHISIDTELVRQ